MIFLTYSQYRVVCSVCVCVWGCVDKNTPPGDSERECDPPTTPTRYSELLNKFVHLCPVEAYYMVTTWFVPPTFPGIRSRTQGTYTPDSRHLYPLVSRRWASGVGRRVAGVTVLSVTVPGVTVLSVTVAGV